MPTDDLPQVQVPELPQLGVAPLLVSIVLYAYLAGCLMVIARKTGTPDGWLAWVPLANLFLVCRIAGRSPAWALMVAFCPCVNLLAVIVLATDVARACGKSPALGMLVLVPGVNLLLPAYLALTADDGSASQSVSVVPPASGSRTSGGGNGLRWVLLFLLSVGVGVGIARGLPYAYPKVDALLSKAIGPGRYTAQGRVRRFTTIGATFAATFLLALLLRPRAGAAGTPPKPSPAAPVAASAAPAKPRAKAKPAPPPPPVAPFTLSVSGRSVPLDDGMLLTFLELPELQPAGGNVVAEVTRNPKEPSQLGLKNRSRGAWSARTPHGEVRAVLPGQSIRLEKGLRINFGPVSGAIV